MTLQFLSRALAELGRQAAGALTITAAGRLNSWLRFLLVLAGSCLASNRGEAGTIFEATSPYHHILVVDEAGIRTLSFDGSMETRMALHDPLKGHFAYTEFFHMPWLWNNQITNVLMLGLGGASTQRAYEHYYPGVIVDSVEIDPVVLKVATNYFHFKPSARQRIHISDGRVFLRRSEARYDAIIMDAYAKNRYGSFIPYHLATKEFFALATNHLTANGVLAYNVIGTMQAWRADILGSIYKTMKSVFPQVYFFPAPDSLNVVVIGTLAEQKTSFQALHKRAAELLGTKQVAVPNFRNRLQAFRGEPPSNFAKSPVLTDDFAPVDGLLTRVK